MTYQPGEYDITNQYFSKDTIERINKKNERKDSNYKPVLDDVDSKDSVSIENTSNNFSIETKSKLINTSNESIVTAKTQASHKNQRKIAAEAGFGIREPSEAHIQINLHDSPTNLNYKENSRTHLTITSRDDNSRNFGTIKKGATLSRPERQLTTRRRNIMRSENELPPMVRTGATSEKNNIDNPIIQQKHVSTWEKISKLCTCCAVPSLMNMCGMTDKNVQQAWREKVTLCIIIFLMMIIMGFLTFGLQPLLCRESRDQVFLEWKDEHGDIVTHDSSVLINGIWYSYNYVNAVVKNTTGKELGTSYKTVDISNLFRACPVGQKCKDECKGIIDDKTLNDCSIQPAKFTENAFKSNCISKSVLQRGRQYAKVAFKWNDVEDNYAGRTRLVVYNGNVLNVTSIIANETLSKMFHKDTIKILQDGVGRDISRDITIYPQARKQINCLLERYTVGVVDKQNPSCYLANAVMIIFLVAILGVVLTRFFMALIFSWFMADKLTVVKPIKIHGKKVDPLEYQVNIQGNGDLYTICLVTCYSEGKEGLQTTLNSLATTTYNDKKKLLFIIADGEVVGVGNDKSTPDIARSMIYEDPALGEAQPKSYLAVATGERQHNMAKVYAGTYQVKNHTVPIIIVAKCGTPAESNTPKPGNRGKRDSQIILMNFLSRVLYNDRMTPLDYELFTKIHFVTGVTPDKFEIVMMVDADTKVLPDSLSYMVNAMRNDPNIMGLCGETRIANKTTSWVTCIQVFEYYISHHLSKAFESVFGGVTCLPGCFCMYRVKAPKISEPSKWIPILANVDIVEEYSENIVDTLHKKNLLLLGEDRFLSTLMLNTFPKRKMVFIPQAKCKTIVPDRFSVLLSQRRRWINSTVHNLMELVLVKDLCGTFCFSMQFVIGLELFGTVVLPAAICFTIYLLCLIIFNGEAPIIPILMLIAILGLPGVLILLTTRKMVYVLWMLVYLLALPIWNLVLPLYAFWHFDDFSWGETRKVNTDGDSVDSSKCESKQNKFDVSTIPLKKWEEYELEARKERAAKMNNMIANANANGIPSPASSSYKVIVNPLAPRNIFSTRDTDSIAESMKSGRSSKSNKNGKKKKKSKSPTSPSLSAVRSPSSPNFSSAKSESSFTSASSPNQYYSQLPPKNIKTNQKIIILPPQTQQQLQQQQQEQQQLQQLDQIRMSYLASGSGASNSNKRKY
jgi:chitin synthase